MELVQEWKAWIRESRESEGVELGTGSTRIEDLTNGVGLNPIERAGIDDPKFPTHAS